MPRRREAKRTVCFVTGTRAEFGLMRPVLDAIRAHPRLDLQIVATGMHLSKAHGTTLNQIAADGFTIDATVAWEQDGSAGAVARATGEATAGMARVFARLKPDVVMVTGDRVEAFAGASAAHLSGIAVAHVHGGDRALGQVDDSLRHAITKLAHVHFPATRQSAQRILKIGEDRWRVHRAGTPGIDGIRQAAWRLDACRERLFAAQGDGQGYRHLTKGRFALLVYHPAAADDALERERANAIFHTTLSVPFESVIVVYPNNDPGSAGIRKCWHTLRYAKYRMTPAQLARRVWIENLPRGAYLGLLRDAAVLVGNSSSGIIEAATFGTPVINIGPRQLGRERSENVTDIPYGQAPLRRALRAVWNDGHPRRYTGTNVYGGGGAGRNIADILGRLPLDETLLGKLIAY